MQSNWELWGTAYQVPVTQPHFFFFPFLGGIGKVSNSQARLHDFSVLRHRRSMHDGVWLDSTCLRVLVSKGRGDRTPVIVGEW